jgi:Pyruvate/2-oxoacid:ferredoxin oxidoreductase gamma subunit
MNIKILLSGDGGQGIQLIADMVIQVAFGNDFFVTSIPNYGLEQRGGVSLNFIQISDKKIVYPKFSKADMLLAMSHQAEERSEGYKNTECRILNIEDFIEKLKENDINLKSYNIFFLGLIARFLEEKNVLKVDDIFKMLEKKLETKSGWEENKKAFELSTL